MGMQKNISLSNETPGLFKGGGEWGDKLKQQKGFAD